MEAGAVPNLIQICLICANQSQDYEDNDSNPSFDGHGPRLASTTTIAPLNGNPGGKFSYLCQSLMRILRLFAADRDCEVSRPPVFIVGEEQDSCYSQGISKAN